MNLQDVEIPKWYKDQFAPGCGFANAKYAHCAYEAWMETKPKSLLMQEPCDEIYKFKAWLGEKDLQCGEEDSAYEITCSQLEYYMEKSNLKNESIQSSSP